MERCVQVSCFFETKRLVYEGKHALDPMVEPDPIPLAPRSTPLTGTVEESWPVGDWSEGGGGGGHDGSKDFGFSRWVLALVRF